MSWALANLIKHELTKTLDPDFLVRGADYPLNGSYQVTGPDVDPESENPFPELSLIVTFSPNGGMNNINKNLIGSIIRNEVGPIRMIQFAFSSPVLNLISRLSLRPTLKTNQADGSVLWVSSL